MKSLAAMASVAVVAMLALSAVPLTAEAGVTDYYFFIGTWTCEEEDNGYTSSVEVVFNMDGTATSTYSYSSDYGSEESTHDFEWKLEDDKLYTRSIDDEGDDYSTEENDGWGDGVLYDFNTLHTELTIGGGDEPYKKKGSVCGSCCGFCFMAIGIPAVAVVGLAGLALRKK